jgi:hypothetical protein
MLIFYGERSPFLCAYFGGGGFGAPLFLPRLVFREQLRGSPGGSLQHIELASYKIHSLAISSLLSLLL